MLLAMRITPGKRTLRNMEKEVKDLENLLSKVSIDTIVRQNPTRTVVLSELPKHSIVHFASHTSAIRNFCLLDESISLSSAIQLSGYPSVVGSLWEVQHEHSSKVARDVYV